MTNTTRRRVRRHISALAWLALGASPLLADALALPSNARQTHQETKSTAVYGAPVAPYSSGTLPVFDVAGQVSKTAYRIPQQGLTPQQIVAPIEEALAERGFEVLFKCRDRYCGGFDFRFATEVIPAPDMFVDLFDFTFVTARHEQAYITLLASRDATAGYLQIVYVSPSRNPSITIENSGSAVFPETSGDSSSTRQGIVEQLEARGRAILDDLDFETGSSELGQAEFGSLKTLAAYLDAHPNRKVALVGHTDSTGGLDVNIALSERRADSVRKRLVERHGIPVDQVEAKGVGYLAPLSTNLTDKGREANRRVEAILLSVE
ncbi:OmpA family protein [Rhodobacteraceae bacterium 63075]|nr:OmpA family protein [Rhodobacteraceae bacterium 63075]